MLVDFLSTLEINGFELTVMVDAEVNQYTENYREDIDGNRAEKTTFIEIKKLRIREMMRSNDITYRIANKYPDQYKLVLNEALDKADGL